MWFSIQNILLSSMEEDVWSFAAPLQDPCAWCRRGAALCRMLRPRSVLGLSHSQEQTKGSLGWDRQVSPDALCLLLSSWDCGATLAA